MGLGVIDGGGNPATLKTTLASGEHIPHHKIEGTADVAVLSLPGMRSNLGEVLVGSTAYTVKVVHASVSGTATLISAVTGKKLRLIGLVVSASAAGTLTLKDSAGGGVIHTAYVQAGGVNQVGPMLIGHLCETSAGNLLEAVVSAGTQSITCIYIEV